MSAFSKVLTERSLTRLINKEKDQLVIHNNGSGHLQEQSLTRAFNYRVKVTIQTGFHNTGRN